MYKIKKILTYIKIPNLIEKIIELELLGWKTNRTRIIIRIKEIREMKGIKELEIKSKYNKRTRRNRNRIKKVGNENNKRRNKRRIRIILNKNIRNRNRKFKKSIKTEKK